MRGLFAAHVILMPSAKRTSWEAVFTFSMTGGIKMKPPGGAEIQIKFGVYDVFLLFILAAPF